MAEAGKKTNKELWAERIKAKNPGKNYENEDEMYADAMSGYDKVNGVLKKRDEEDARVVAMLKENPDVMNFISVFTQTGDFGKAAAELPDYAKFTPEEQASYDESKKRRLKENEEYNKRETLRNSNLQKSAEQLKEWSEKNDIPVETCVEMIDMFVNTFIKKLDSGEFDEDMFEKMYRLFNYDKDMEAKYAAGKLDGRNEGVQQRTQRMAAGDGLPHPQPSSATQGERKEDKDPMLGALKRVADRNAIFNFKG